LRGSAAQGGDHPGLIAGILLAAGLSRRFGRQKLLEPWEGEPLVRRSVRRLLEAQLSPVVAVVSSDGALAAAVAELPVTLVLNEQPEKGISGSIALGIGTLPHDCEAALIGVADQPLLTAQALKLLMQAYRRGAIVAARYGDHLGNPAIFDRRFLPELCQLRGDAGGLRVIQAHPDQLIEVELPAAMGQDVDRPEDWPPGAGRHQ
jgi:molybdenum cofactor cytidylyltransferase